MNISKICILGAGTLGSRVALQSAISEYDVRVYDINQKGLDFSLKTMEDVLHQLQKENQITEENAKAALARITFTLDPMVAAADADLINESVPEDLGLKNKVWKQFGEIAPEKTIFTTNSSYLLPSQLAEVSGRPARFCALHFHDVFNSRVVDIMPHPGTDLDLIPILKEVGRRLNQVPVLVKKENPGYVCNTMLMALVSAAGKLKTNDVADIEDIDRSWMVNFHLPKGPFGILDHVGLETAWHLMDHMPDRDHQAFAELLKTYVDQGKLGEKSGEGFYKYPNPSYLDPDFIK